jgi:hypothetical protein
VQLHQPKVLQALAEREARLLVVSFATLPYLQKWVPHFCANFLEPYYQEQKLPLEQNPLARTEFLADPGRKVYHAYGLGQNSVFKIYGPGIMTQYLRWAIQGKKIRLPTEDTLQMGGDFVINRAGRLTFSHLGRDQADRPPVANLLKALS